MIILSQVASTYLTTRMVQIAIPPADAYGRHRTLNRMGKADSNPNEVTQAFIEWAASRAQNHPAALCRDTNYVLEVGGGYGFVAREAIARGAWYLFNDADRRHVAIAESQFPETECPSQYETRIGKFPNKVDIVDIKQNYPIVGIGSFSVVHFMRASEIRNLLDVFWDLLKPGGRVFLTAGTPWNGLFRGFPSEYRRRKARFMRDPEKHPFPGEMEDAARYLPQEQYPRFFHALDGDILTYLARSNPEKAFSVVQVVPIQRPQPPEQAYRRGYSRGQTEIIGIILEKPPEPSHP